MSLVSFFDYVPTPRYDGFPWTQVVVEESASGDGPWVQIDQFNLAPVDADPSAPTTRSFTTDNATLDEGWYRITFKDAQGNQSHAVPVHNIPSGESEWLPTIKDVALKIMSRTRDTFGRLTGTFNENTTPNTVDVMRIIQQAATEVSDAIGDDIPEALWDDAQNITAIKAAMQIEMDYYSDQVNTGRSIFPQLEKTYQSALTALQRSVTLALEGADAVRDSGPGLAPSYNFPDASGWETRIW